MTTTIVNAELAQLLADEAAEVHSPREEVERLENRVHELGPEPRRARLRLFAEGEGATLPAAMCPPLPQVSEPAAGSSLSSLSLSLSLFSPKQGGGGGGTGVRLRLAEDESEDAKAQPDSTMLELMPHDARCVVLEFSGVYTWLRAVPTVTRGLRDLCKSQEMRAVFRRHTSIIEWLPHDMRCAVLEFAGGDEWMRAVPIVSRGLRDLCARKEMRDAVRRWAMGVFKRGMDLYHGYSGVVRDRDAGKALIRRAAEAGLRSARALCHRSKAWLHRNNVKHAIEHAKAFLLLHAEFEGSAGETEASGGPCVHAAFMLGYCYEHGLTVEIDEARALELYHHAVEVDNNQSAMSSLARVYQWGYLGLDVDYERGVSLEKRGAELGHYFCRLNLGYVYMHGQWGVEVDLKQALYWLEKANEQTGGGQATAIRQVRERMRTTSGEE